MANSELTIYAGCFAEHFLKYQSQYKTIPVFCGTRQWRATKKQLVGNYDPNDYIFDDGFLSCENNYWADLSCIGTILEQDIADDALIGNAQYRRSWDEEAVAKSDSATLYVPEPAFFSYSLKEQFQRGHGDLAGYELSIEAAKSGLLPLSADELDSVWQQNQLHGCLMARGPKRLYFPFMDMLINQFCWSIWNINPDYFLSQSGYNQRGIAFIAERMFTAMVMYRGKLNLGAIQTAPIVFHGP